MPKHRGTENRSGDSGGQADRLHASADTQLHHRPLLHSGLPNPPEILSREWPRIEATLRRDLRRLVSPADTDDIVQKVYLRLAPRADEFTAEHLRNRARLAARNLAYNLLRDGQAHAQPVGTLLDLPEVPSPYGVDEEYEAAVEGAVMLQRMQAALAECSPTERTAIASLLAGDPGGRNQDVRLHRARKRLRSALEGMLGASPVWNLRRRLGVWMQPATAAGGSLAVAAVATLGSLVGPPTVAVVNAGAPGPAHEKPVLASPTTAVSGVPQVVQPRHVAAPPPAAPPPRVADTTVAVVPSPSGGEPAVVIGGGRRQGRESLACTGTDGLAVVGNLCIPRPAR